MCPWAISNWRSLEPTLLVTAGTRKAESARPTANGFAPEMAHSGVSQDAWLRWFDNSARVTT
jgi:hypothetical protein